MRGKTCLLYTSSFRIAPGETLGIMGMTGTGKTTIVNLLQRFYDVTSGRILLDGQDIRTIPLIQLRAAMSVVMQEDVYKRQCIICQIFLCRQRSMHLV